MNLDLAAIREGAMNPPAGTARQYEDMFARQLEQAAADERRLRREGMEAAMQRALDRSGLYNVGSMMIPQDAGEVALGLAMTPGIGMGLRTALAGLGGMTTQIGDAEGAFLPKFMLQRLLGSSNPAARRAGDEGLDALNRAELSPGGRDWRRASTPEDFNARFENTLYDTSEFNVLPTEAGFSWALPPARTQEFYNLFDAGDLVRNTGVSRRARRQALVNDPLLEEALPASSRMNAGIVAVGRPQGNVQGSYSPDTGLVRVNAGSPAQMRDTFSHEMQHWIQAETPGRYARGTSPGAVGSVNPNLWDEYLAEAMHPGAPPGWGSVPGGATFGSAERDAAFQMYGRNFGEWEARLAALHDRFGAGAPQGINPLGYTLDEFFTQNSLPDFRIR